MATAALKIRLNYNQVLDLARQLSDEEKLMLNQTLTAETKSVRLKRLLAAFKNDEISLNEIDSEVEKARQELYEKRQQN